MSKRITTIDGACSLALPPEAVDALGVKPGENLDVEVVGRAVVVRSVEEAQRSRHFMNSFESILQSRRKAYEKLAEGPER